MSMKSEGRRSLRRWIHPIEAVPIALIYGLLWLIPLDLASAMGGWLARRIGPLLPVNKIGRQNLRRAFPDWSEERIERTLGGVWDNLGRTVAEYPHLSQILRERVTTHSALTIEEWRASRESKSTAIFFSGHFANWEIMPLYAAFLGFPLISVYRTVNNPYVDRLVRFSRRQNTGRLVPKGAAGLREVISAMKEGEPLGLLVDQKLNAGIAVPFFGHDAMTGTVLAQLAYRFHCPILPARVERTGGAHFRLTVDQPVTLVESGDRDSDIRAATASINQMIESWIRDQPEQWLWLHRRWPKEDMAQYDR